MDDEAVLRKMAEQFALGRLREATRARFEAPVSPEELGRTSAANIAAISVTRTSGRRTEI